MKFWRFYQKPKKKELEAKKSKGCSIEEMYPLYAYTNKKKVALAFIQERAMSKFLVGVSDDIELSEYIEFVNNNRGEEISFYEVPTAIHKFTNEQKIIDVQLALTFNEKQLLDNIECELSDQMYWYGMPCPDIFTKKYQKLLDKLDYNIQYKLMTDYHPMDDDEADYSAPDIDYDTLACFLHEYGHLFDDNGKDSKLEFLEDFV